MLENVVDLTLETQVWCEYDYNRAPHEEIGQSPLACFLAGPEVLRSSPDSAALRAALRAANDAGGARATAPS